MGTGMELNLKRIIRRLGGKNESLTNTFFLYTVNLKSHNN